MRNNHFFKTQLLLAALAATLLIPVSTFSQQRSSSKTTTIKDSDIYVPDKVLEPSYTKKEASDLLKEYIAAFGDSDMPESYEVFARDPDKYKRIGTRQLQAAMGNLYNYVHDPDIQEVTGYKDSWFRALYNKALELKEPAALMDKAIRLKNATLYTQAAQAYAAKYDELQRFSKKPERLSAEQLRRLTEANKAKRRAEYIALRKQQILDQEAAAKKAAEDEMKKASAGSRNR